MNVEKSLQPTIPVLYMTVNGKSFIKLVSIASCSTKLVQVHVIPPKSGINHVHLRSEFIQFLSATRVSRRTWHGVPGAQLRTHMGSEHSHLKPRRFQHKLIAKVTSCFYVITIVSLLKLDFEFSCLVHQSLSAFTAG